MLETTGQTVVRGSRYPVLAAHGQRWVSYGGIGSDTDWDAALETVKQVVHLAGIAHLQDAESAAASGLLQDVNVLGAARLAQAAAARGVGRFIFVSSALVHGSSSRERAFVETDPLRPIGAYARSKAEAEERLRRVAEKARMELIILRPPMVYGRGARGNFRRLTKLVRLGMPLPLGRATAPRSFIGVDNLADVVACCTRHREAAGRTLLVADADTSSTVDLIEKIAQALGRRGLLFNVPVGLLRTMARAIGRERDFHRLFAPFALDTRAVTAHIGWRAPVPMSAGIRQAIGTAPQ
jgi:nucleoside-diphosphate-sugar epimerase